MSDLTIAVSSSPFSGWPKDYCQLNAHNTDGRSLLYPGNIFHINLGRNFSEQRNDIMFSKLGPICNDKS